MAAKILVVDDDANVQRLLQYTLKQEGYDVVIAPDGAEGFRLWGAEAPDLILLDVQLPKLDGYQVAAKIRDALLGQPAVGFELLFTRAAHADAHLHARQVLPHTL